MTNDLPQRLRDLAEYLNGPVWTAPDDSGQTCREAADCIDTLRGALDAQDGRERQAGDRCGVSWLEHGCDWPDRVADVVVRLRAMLRGYHLDAVCGACGGPLEQDRDAICGRCTRDNELVHLRAEVERLREALERIMFTGLDWSGHGSEASFYKGQIQAAVAQAARVLAAKAGGEE